MVVAKLHVKASTTYLAYVKKQCLSNWNKLLVDSRFDENKQLHKDCTIYKEIYSVW